MKRNIILIFVFTILVGSLISHFPVALSENNQSITISMNKELSDSTATLGNWLSLWIDISGGSGVYWYRYKIEHYIFDQWIITEEDTNDTLISSSENDIGWTIYMHHQGAIKLS